MTAEDIKIHKGEEVNYSHDLRKYLNAPHPKLYEEQSGIIHLIGVADPEEEIPQLLEQEQLPQGPLVLTIAPNCLNEETRRNLINIWVQRGKRGKFGGIHRIRMKHKYLIVIDGNKTNITALINAFEQQATLLEVDNRLEKKR